jgi:hypothetical protein
MAHPTEKSKRLAELVKRGEASRRNLTNAHAGLMQAIDLPSRIKASMSGSPAKWLGGSLAAGLAVSLLFRPGKKKAPSRLPALKRERGFLSGLLALAFSLSKPALKIYATKLLKDYLARRLSAGAQGRPFGVRTPPY